MYMAGITQSHTAPDNITLRLIAIDDNTISRTTLNKMTSLPGRTAKQTRIVRLGGNTKRHALQWKAALKMNLAILNQLITIRVLSQ